MAKVIFRINKIKSFGQMSLANAHNVREINTPNASGKIIAVKHPENIVEAAKKVIGDQKIRKNAVLGVEVLLTASPEYFRPECPKKAGYYDEERLKAFRDVAEKFISEHFPHAVSVVLHLDESTPHYHIIDIPLDEKGKLNAREKYGGAKKLSEWQDKVAAAFENVGLDRGIKKSKAKHVKIKEFYGNINSNLPDLPEPAPNPPKPLPPKKLIEKVPFTRENEERKRKEERYKRARAEYVRKTWAYNSAAANSLKLYIDKAAIAEIARKKQAELEKTLRQIEREKDAQKAQADRLRALNLVDVLKTIYSAKEEKDSKPEYSSRKFVLPDGRKIGVTGNLWVYNDGSNRGGKNAINLVMSLDNLDYKGAVRLLADHFEYGVVASDLARSAVEKIEKEVETIAKSEPVPVPIPAESKWGIVKKYLCEIRGLPSKLIDQLHSIGLVFADSNENAVFRRVKGGAFVRGTKGDFKRTIGKADCGPFLIPGKPEKGIYFTEGPIDAIAVKSIKPDAIVMCTGGAMLSVFRLKEMFKDVFAKCKQFYAAFDNDDTGEKLAKLYADELKAERFAPPFRYKDFAEAVGNDKTLIHESLRDSTVSSLEFSRDRDRGFDISL